MITAPRCHAGDRVADQVVAGHAPLCGVMPEIGVGDPDLWTGRSARPSVHGPFLPGTSGYRRSGTTGDGTFTAERRNENAWAFFVAVQLRGTRTEVSLVQAEFQW